jgi:hypothetical protein
VNKVLEERTEIGLGCATLVLVEKGLNEVAVLYFSVMKLSRSYFFSLFFFFDTRSFS